MVVTGGAGKCGEVEHVVVSHHRDVFGNGEPQLLDLVIGTHGHAIATAVVRMSRGIKTVPSTFLKECNPRLS